LAQIANVVRQEANIARQQSKLKLSLRPAESECTTRTEQACSAYRPERSVRSPSVKSTGKSSLTISAKPGWSWGWVSALDREGRTIWIVDAHGYGKCFIVRADEVLAAFLELDPSILTEQACSVILRRSRYSS
jgi:hypothetical protein